MNKFRVSFVVEASNLGDILAFVHGKANDLDVGLVESVPHTKNKKVTVKRPPRGAAQDAFLKALAEAPEQTMSAKEGFDALAAAGFAGDAIYNMRTALQKRGLIEVRNKKMRLVK